MARQNFFLVFRADAKNINPLKFIFTSLCIALAMMLDDVQGIKIALTEQSISIYYCFFNSIVFSGMFGTYFTASLCVIPYANAYVRERGAGMDRYVVCRAGTANYIRSKFLSGALSSGLCMSFGYGLFMLILSSRTSFVNQQDLLSGLDYFPYVAMSLEGGATIHILLILYYGLLTGTLWGGLSVFVSAFVNDTLIIAAVPFIGKFFIVQLYRMLRVPEQYRLDFWIYMGEMWKSIEFTAILSFICISLILILCYLGFSYKVKGSVAYGKISTRLPKSIS